LASCACSLLNPAVNTMKKMIVKRNFMISCFVCGFST
jgi:hypothetical protein